jgi:hypothetical protein
MIIVRNEDKDISRYAVENQVPVTSTNQQADLNTSSISSNEVRNANHQTISPIIHGKVEHPRTMNPISVNLDNDGTSPRESFAEERGGVGRVSSVGQERSRRSLGEEPYISPDYIKALARSAGIYIL